MNRISLVFLLACLASCSPPPTGSPSPISSPTFEKIAASDTRTWEPTAGPTLILKEEEENPEKQETGLILPSPSPSLTITCTLTPTLTETATFTKTDSPTPSPRFSPTRTPIPSNTLTPSLTYTPTKSPYATEWPPIKSQGPYLVYRTRDYAVMINPDGSGRKAVKIPGGWNLSLSPAGEWGVLVKEHGSFYDIGYADQYLSLMHIPDGWIRSLGLIFSADTLGVYDCYEGGPGSGYSILESDWSPDGRYFAFAADPTGKSVDLYAYDTENRTLRQLTKSIGDVVEIAWSPDSKDILFKSGKLPFVGNICCYDHTSMNITRPGNGTNQGILELSVSEGFCEADLSGGLSLKPFHRWIGPNSLLFFQLDLVHDVWFNSLILVDLDTKISKKIWTGSMFLWNLDYDPEEKTFLLYEWGDNYSAGYYLISTDGKILKRIDFTYREDNQIKYRGGAKHRFLIQDATGVYGVESDGTVQRISDKEFPDLRFSPDHRWMLGKDWKGTDLYDAADERVAHSDLAPASITWNPDGSGFYFLAAGEDKTVGLYFWSIAESAPKVVFSLPAENPFAPYGGLAWMN